MEERSDISNELFNFTKDTVTVKQVAQLCKKYNSKVLLIETNDEVPNLGFSLSNKKILKTGFKFLYNLEDSFKEMIMRSYLYRPISRIRNCYCFSFLTKI